MGLGNLVINIIVFVGMSLFMSAICINMSSSKGDNRNTGAGYRTKRSMKSIECWNVGNKTFGYCAIPIAAVESISIYIEDKVLVRQNIVLSKHIIIINLIIFIFGIFIGYLITEKKIKDYGGHEWKH